MLCLCTNRLVWLVATLIDFVEFPSQGSTYELIHSMFWHLTAVFFSVTPPKKEAVRCRRGLLWDLLYQQTLVTGHHVCVVLTVLTTPGVRTFNSIHTIILSFTPLPSPPLPSPPQVAAGSHAVDVARHYNALEAPNMEKRKEVTPHLHSILCIAVCAVCVLRLLCYPTPLGAYVLYVCMYVHMYTSHTAFIVHIPPLSCACVRTHAHVHTHTHTHTYHTHHTHRVLSFTCATSTTG